MIKKIKIGFLSLVALSLMFINVSLVSAANLTYSNDTTIDLSSPDINLTILSGSGATSLVVNAGTVVVTVPVSTTFTISSADRELSFTGQSQFGVISANCSSAQLHTLTITAPSDTAQTITLTPLSYACFPSGGGGGGGGGAYVPPVTPATPATPATPGTEIPGCGNRTTGFSTSTGVSCVGNTSTTPATPATPASPSSASEHRNSFNFGTKTLKNGSRGEAVMELQRFLNQVLNLGLVVDGKLGPKTIKVIKQWQKDNGLVADGLVGPKTKAMMNASVQ